MSKFYKISVLSICILICIVPTVLLGQAPDTLWTKIYDGGNNEVGCEVQQTSDGGYIIIGYTNSFGAGGYDVWLLKMDSFGDTIWTRTYGGINDDYGTSVQQTADGGYIIVGNTASFGAARGDIWLIKTDPLGDTSWTRTYGDTTREWAHSVQQTADGGYVIGGGYKWGDDYIDVYGLIKKVDAAGYELWSEFGGDDFSDIALTLDGGCIGVGGVHDSHHFWFIFVKKVDSLGNTEWGHTYFNYYLSWGSSIQQTKDEGYIILGYTGNQLLLFKTDHQGNVFWNKTYGGASGSSVIEVTRNGYIVTGAFASGRTRDPDLFLMRTDSLGDTLRTKTYGGNKGCSVQQTADGGYVIVGRAGDPGYYDIYLVKTQSELSIDTIQTTIDVTPDVLNLKSHGRWITCYIELPEDYCAEDIDISTVALTAVDNEPIDPPLCREGPTDIDDYDKDGIEDLMVKFNRQNLIGIIIEKTEPPVDVELTISGELDDDTSFEGMDIIHVIHPGGPQTAEQENLPCTFILFESYPNPFSSNTDIRYALPANAQVKLDIYDVSGREVKTLVSDVMKAGYHDVSWDGTDDSGKRLPSGIYYLKFTTSPVGTTASGEEAGGYARTKKLLLIRKGN